MKLHFNRDVIVALVLLLTCGVFINATLDIPEPMFRQMSAALWPRIILAPLTLLTLAYLVRSIFQEGSGREKKGGIVGWFDHYLNPIICFVLFFLFLISLPYVGMLIGGLLFVFLMLTVLGPFDTRHVILHATIAVVSVGAMWALFTFGLGVILPEGELINFR